MLHYKRTSHYLTATEVADICYNKVVPMMDDEEQIARLISPNHIWFCPGGNRAVDELLMGDSTGVAR